MIAWTLMGLYVSIGIGGLIYVKLSGRKLCPPGPVAVQIMMVIFLITIWPVWITNGTREE